MSKKKPDCKDDPTPDILYDPSAPINPEKSILKLTDQEEEFVNECALFNFTDMKKQKELQLGPADEKRKYMRVSPGLNLKGKCENNKCASKNQGSVSWVRKEYGNFNIGQAKFKNKCQSCDQQIKGSTITTFGFYLAKVDAEGLMIEKEKQVDFKKTFEEKEGKFIYFEEEQSITKWAFLNLSVTKL